MAAISSQSSVSGKVETSREDLLPKVEPRSAERRPPSTAPASWIWINHHDGSQSLSPDVELLLACVQGEVGESLDLKKIAIPALPCPVPSS